MKNEVVFRCSREEARLLDVIVEKALNEGYEEQRSARDALGALTRPQYLHERQVPLDPHSGELYDAQNRLDRAQRYVTRLRLLQDGLR